MASRAPPKDIDMIQTDPAQLARHSKTLRRTAVAIPIERVGVFDAPYSYEERLLELGMPSLKKLQLRIPERTTSR